MVNISTEDYVEKWGRRLKGSAEDMRKAAEKVKVAPTAEAAKKIEKMKTNFNAAVESGKIKRQLEKVSLEDWKKAYIETGVGRVSGGVDKAAPKMTTFGNWLLPKVSTLQSEVEKLPDLTLEDNIGRANAWIRGMAKNKYK